MRSSLYIHWPFCESKCPYCDFNSHVREKINYTDWEEAYLKEIDFYSSLLSPKTEITSIFFGGGTPSLMLPQTIEKILERISERFSLKSNIEITLEANPSSSEIQKFRSFKKSGINRLSLGIQSFNEENLKFLGRRHNSTQAIEAIKMAGEVFDNFSFDLIYALPNQNLDNWQQELDFAFGFKSPHLSLYQLTIEKGTDFYSQHKNKKFTLPPTELQEKLYDITVKKAHQAGLLQYEISNFARSGFESQHNMNYWKYGNYIGIGAGAHGRISNPEKTQTTNIHNPEKWLRSVQEKGHGTQSEKIMPLKEQLEELIYMGLRIKKGLSRKEFKKLSKKFFEDHFDKKLIKNLIDSNYIKITKTHIKPTYQGMLLHRSIVSKLCLPL